MGSYKLSEDARTDLIRIYHHGLRSFGEAQADEYFYSFIEQFQKIADAPFIISWLMNFVKATAAAFVVLIAFTSSSMTTALWKSCQ